MISAWIARMIARLYDPAEEARRAQSEESRIIDKLHRHNVEAMKQSARNSLPDDFDDDCDGWKFEPPLKDR